MAAPEEIVIDPLAEEQQARALAARYRYAFVDLPSEHIQSDLFRSIPVELMFRRNIVLAAEFCQNPACDVHHAERMCETGMFRALICEMSEPQLPHAPKPLEFRRIYQTSEQVAVRFVSFEANNVVHRIAINSFAQSVACIVFADSVYF